MSEPKMLDKTVRLLFRTKETQTIALVLLTEIKNRQIAGKPYTADEYHQFCKENGFSEQTYQSVLSRLREYGVVQKVGGHHAGRIMLNTYFMFQLLKEWFEFVGVEYKSVS